MEEKKQNKNGDGNDIFSLFLVYNSCDFYMESILFISIGTTKSISHDKELNPHRQVNWGANLHREGR